MVPCSRDNNSSRSLLQTQFGGRAGKKIKALLYRPCPFDSESGILVRRCLLGVVDDELSGVMAVIAQIQHVFVGFETRFKSLGRRRFFSTSQKDPRFSVIDYDDTKHLKGIFIQDIYDSAKESKANDWICSRCTFLNSLAEPSRCSCIYCNPFLPQDPNSNSKAIDEGSNTEELAVVPAIYKEGKVAKIEGASIIRNGLN